MWCRNLVDLRVNLQQLVWQGYLNCVRLSNAKSMTGKHCRCVSATQRSLSTIVATLFISKLSALPSWILDHCWWGPRVITKSYMLPLWSSSTCSSVSTPPDNAFSQENQSHLILRVPLPTCIVWLVDIVCMPDGFYSRRRGRCYHNCLATHLLWRSIQIRRVLLYALSKMNHPEFDCVDDIAGLHFWMKRVLLTISV